jgi:hypothetical protein
MKNNLKKIIVFCLITLSSLNSFAQPGIEDEINGNLESTDAPIGDFIIPMLILGIALSFYLLKKRKTA